MQFVTHVILMYVLLVLIQSWFFPLGSSVQHLLKYGQSCTFITFFIGFCLFLASFWVLHLAIFEIGLFNYKIIKNLSKIINSGSFHADWIIIFQFFWLKHFCFLVEKFGTIFHSFLMACRHLETDKNDCGKSFFI